MTINTSVTEHATLARYYDVLGAAAEAYRDGRDLLPLLADDFVFDGPIAGRVTGAARFAHGVRGFIENAGDITPLQVVIGDAAAAVLYDAEMPGGPVRFSEFFVFDGDRISELRIQYDAADYVAKGGR
ncbi:nuclear transport factor 2 family protein [Microbacterium jejuense]|uniref:Nuclear transport factor 2 family protein n=1 Tax=Microbacterium jejuense TaxID=1263637 RepID=A0ABS7HSH5_9MICO|nr:nuclear transport factor 2 family protein [Microbacterium jejuense]MBW9095384.1 nuclear transport factor 2 family protein [Microbacterium jejuense]